MRSDKVIEKRTDWLTDWDSQDSSNLSQLSFFFLFFRLSCCSAWVAQRSETNARQEVSELASYTLCSKMFQSASQSPVKKDKLPRDEKQRERERERRHTEGMQISRSFFCLRERIKCEKQRRESFLLDKNDCEWPALNLSEWTWEDGDGDRNGDSGSQLVT